MNSIITSPARMRRGFSLVVLLALLTLAAPHSASAAQAEDLLAVSLQADAGSSITYEPMYRLYNPFSGEHFYTAEKSERNRLAGLGWHYEGPGWMAPSSGEAVYRLYNRFSGDHHYTRDKDERDELRKQGWKSEGVGWFSPKDSDGPRKPLYRQYNPNAEVGTHNYTLSASESKTLVKKGWIDEGVAWYGRAVPSSFADDLAPWTAHISGDVALDTQLDMILLEHDTLRSCYDYVATYTYRAGNEFYDNPHFLPDDLMTEYAKEMIARGSGNCYRFSSLFCLLARGLGYEANVVSGWVPSYTQGRAPHSWVEVTIDGQALVCDPDMYEAVPNRNWYLVTYDEAPAEYGSW